MKTNISQHLKVFIPILVFLFFVSCNPNNSLSQEEPASTSVLATSIPTSQPSPTPEPNIIILTKQPSPTPITFEIAAGTWVSTDGDGSNQTLNIEFVDGSYSINYIDDGASSCGKDAAGNPLYGGHGIGNGIAEELTLTVNLDWYCMNANNDFLTSIQLTYIYKSSRDSIVDSFGIEWTRSESISTIPSSTDSLAGVMVYPIDTLNNGIPWLPLDESKRPMTVYYWFSFNKPPFNNVLVRKAFAAALDKEKIAEMARGFQFQDATPATTLTPPKVLGRDLYGKVGISFNPTLAKKYLEEAGYTDGVPFPTITLMVYMRGEAAPSSYDRIATDLIIPMWEEHLGVTVELINIGKLGGGIIASSIKKFSPDIFLLAWGADYIDPENFLRELFLSSNTLNLGNFSNMQFDSLVNQAYFSTDPAERMRLYIKAERILSEEEVGIIPLFHTIYYQQP